MLFGVLPIFLIVLGLAILIVLIVRKFPQLRVLDVEALPEEKDRVKKEKILEERFSKAFEPVREKTRAVGSRVYSWFEKIQKRFRAYVNRIADRYREEHGKVVKQRFSSQAPRERIRQLNTLLEEADTLRRNDDLVHAEEKYIAAIALAPKSARAYKGLGKIYFAQEKYMDAKETFTFVTQIDKDDDVAHAFLGRIAKAEHRWEDAVKSYKHALALKGDLGKRWLDLGMVYRIMGSHEQDAKEALLKAHELEPKNPAVLDQIIIFALEIGDKQLARDMYAQLQEVNPENQKLGELKEAIQALR